ncbi:MAG: CotH kinase family protein [Vicinamibacterales bacterium]
MRYLLAIVAAVAGLLSVVSAQGPGGFPGAQDQPLVERFDSNGDTWLNAAERKTAREWLDRQRSGVGGFGRRGGGFGGFGGIGGRGFAAATPGRSLKPADVRTYPASVPFYDVNALRTIFIQFEEADWEAELEAFYRTDVDVPATVVIDGRTYRDVGVHFRGQSSFGFVPSGSKRSLNLALDLINENQSVGTYRTLNLLNANGDATFVRPVLYAAIARSYIPAPAANYARVVINGENWGVYVNTQQFNRDFLRDNFKTTDGARWRVPGMPGGRGGMEYLGNDPAVYKTTYEIRTRDSEKSWRDLIHLFQVLNETPADRLEAALTPLLDVDATLKFLALEVALVNSDGYWARASDYSIYQDPQGRFHVIPHDMNEGLAEERGPGGRGRGGPPAGFTPPPGFTPPQGFGGFPGGMFPDASVELDPLVGLTDSSKPLRSKLLAVPVLRARYLGYVRDIAQKWLEWKTIEPMTRQYQAVIADEIRLDTKKLYSTEAFTAGIAGPGENLKEFMERRRAYLLEHTPPR